MARINASNVSIGMNAQDAKIPGYREGTTKNGDKYISLNLYAKDDNNNRINFESFGMESKVIKTMDNDGNKIEINWEDRFDPEVISNCRNVHILAVNGERHQFISGYDMNQYIIDHFDEIKEKKLTITATISKDFYNSVIRNRYQIQNIYEANEDTKSVIRCSVEYFWNKDCIDTADFVYDRKTTINGYSQEYIPEIKERRYVPMPLMLDCSKIDFDNEKHVKMLAFKLILNLRLLFGILLLLADIFESSFNFEYVSDIDLRSASILLI